MASLLILIAWFAIPTHAAFSMQAKIVDDQLILTGDVVNGDFDKIQGALVKSPNVNTVILRNSHGGDAATGYQVGELFRQKSFRTAVSGFCFSSCSRMFLGGKLRLFTDDMPTERTDVGFHGHYDGIGRLMPHVVDRFGLKDWIVRYSDGKADPALIERWISIPVSGGMIHFLRPGLAQQYGASTFMCQGPNPPGKTIFDCEPIAKTALDLGIITAPDVISSNDFAAARNAMPDLFAPSGYASIDDLEKVPLLTPQGMQEYRRFLEAGAPRAFAVAPDRNHWAWNNGIANAAVMALMRCAERAGQTCQLYAIDNNVIWTDQ
jgi:hypothetical protein